MRYTLELDCRRCGHPLEHAASGTSDGRSTRAIANCPRCRDDWLIEVTVSSSIGAVLTGQRASARTVAVCGTVSGHRAHRRRNEPICDACRQAHAIAERLRRERHRKAALA